MALIILNSDRPAIANDMWSRMRFLLLFEHVLPDNRPFIDRQICTLALMRQKAPAERITD